MPKSFLLPKLLLPAFPSLLVSLTMSPGETCQIDSSKGLGAFQVFRHQDKLPSSSPFERSTKVHQLHKIGREQRNDQFPIAERLQKAQDSSGRAPGGSFHLARARAQVDIPIETAKFAWEYIFNIAFNTYPTHVANDERSRQKESSQRWEAGSRIPWACDSKSNQASRRWVLAPFSSERAICRFHVDLQIHGELHP